MKRKPNKAAKLDMKAPSAHSSARRTRVDASEAAKLQSRLSKVLKWRGGARIGLPIEDGCVFVVSDQHYAPSDPPSPAHLASLRLAELLQPFAIINNGDTIDGASISRWPVGSFTELKGRPTVAEELGVAAVHLADYEALDFVKYRVWNLGNHDARFETRLADKVPEYAGVAGFVLKEHFRGWMPAWRTDLVKGSKVQVIVKHRFKGGMHAGQNNSLWSGTSIVTGHDHMLKAYPITDVNGLRWGIHAGTMAPLDTPTATHYTEDNVVNWQPGFVILHFRGGTFVGPELINCVDYDRILFRGDVLEVS